MTERIRKSAETTKVILKINFSKPLLENEDLPPNVLERPVPLDWISTRKTRIVDRSICNIKVIFDIS